MSRSSADPERLEAIRNRLGALGSLYRKYGASDEEVLTFLEESSERLRTLTGADERIVALEARHETLETSGRLHGRGDHA